MLQLKGCHLYDFRARVAKLADLSSATPCIPAVLGESKQCLLLTSALICVWTNAEWPAWVLWWHSPCGFPWPVAASTVLVPHCSSTEDQVSLNFSFQASEQAPELIGLRPTSLFQKVSFETLSKTSPPHPQMTSLIIKSLAWTYLVYLCSDQEQLLNPLQVKKRARRLRYFAEGLTSWFQSWNLTRAPVCFPVNL